MGCINSVSHQRGVKTYLKPAQFKFIKGLSALNETSESKAVATAVQKLYDATPMQERERIKKAASKNAY